MVFPPILDAIISRFKWQGALLFEGLIILVCGLFGLLYRPLKPIQGIFITFLYSLKRQITRVRMTFLNVYKMFYK